LLVVTTPPSIPTGKGRGKREKKGEKVPACFDIFGETSLLHESHMTKCQKGKEKKEK